MELARAAPIAFALSLALASALAAGCGDDGGGGLDAETSRAVFEAANDEIHALHLEALELDQWPVEYMRECSDGGSITMESELDGADFVALYHSFDGCASGGYTFDGDIDYTEISFCDDGGEANVTITGELVVDGHGTCAIEAVETCGAVTGTACGAEL